MARSRGRAKETRSGNEGARRRSEESRSGRESKTESAEEAGQLIFVATPIGNLGDFSPRAKEVFDAADFVVAEDTRTAARLLSHLGLKKPLIRIDEHSSENALDRVIDECLSGKTGVVTSDAGTPCISDPGARLADQAIENGICIDSVPGPSAPANALVLSGFFAQRYVFLGYLPRKPGPMAKEFEMFVDSTIPIVLFEAPQRVWKTLEVAKSRLGNRRIAICREMTKKFQEVIRLNLEELEQHKKELKGEICVVIEGKRRTYTESD